MVDVNHTGMSMEEWMRAERILRSQLEVGHDPRRSGALKDSQVEQVYHELLRKGKILLDGQLNFKAWR